MYLEINIHTGQKCYRTAEGTSARLEAMGYVGEYSLNEMEAGHEIETDHAWFRKLGKEL